MSPSRRPEPALAFPYYRAPYFAAIKRFFLKYGVFRGRASRSEYWWWMLTSWIVTGILNNVGNFTGRSDAVDPFFESLPFGLSITAPNPIAFTFWALTVVPSLALLWRRIHDTDHSGAWFFIGFIPILGWVALFVLTVTRPDPEGARFDPPRSARVPRS